MDNPKEHKVCGITHKQNTMLTPNEKGATSTVVVFVNTLVMHKSQW